MNKPDRKRLGDLLIDNNMITQTQLEEALKAQTIYGGKLGTNLVELGYISEAQLTNFLSVQLQIPSAKPEDFSNISPELLKIVSKDFASSNKIIPLKKSGKRLKVAVADPYNVKAIDELAFKTSLIIDLHIAPEILIVYALETYYGVTRETRYIKLSGVTGEEIRLTNSLAEEIGFSSDKAERSKTHPYPINRLSSDLAGCSTKEEIFNIIFKYFEYYFQKLATFVVRPACLQGFVTQGFQISKENFQKFEIPLDKKSIFKDVLDKQVIYYGNLEENEIHEVLLSTLNITDKSKVYIIPLFLNNQAISILFCNGFKDLNLDDIPVKDFDTVAKKVSFAFQILFLKKRILSQNS